jgi:hypothetical protein
MKTLVRLCRRLLPLPPHSQLAEHMAFFNAPRIYMPSASDERVRNRTVRRTPASSKAANERQLLSSNT